MDDISAKEETEIKGTRFSREDEYTRGTQGLSCQKAKGKGKTYSLKPQECGFFIEYPLLDDKNHFTQTHF